ncbi:hypothetical protein LshimejAT787_1700380 [Lyophyllum shimeji]|uniref:Uncharacterized protein n=1 Tax=Lyophyllum shimeji TaxID=47721 RepID=A0A9P3UVR6_LYOSH|nr:hypothetical protein LshimejAT787_1700380 [Lyophyllum shimeji]
MFRRLLKDTSVYHLIDRVRIAPWRCSYESCLQVQYQLASLRVILGLAPTNTHSQAGSIETSYGSSLPLSKQTSSTIHIATMANAYRVPFLSAIVLFGADHDKLWDFRHAVSYPPQVIERLVPKIKGYQAAYGTPRSRAPLPVSQNHNDVHDGYQSSDALERPVAGMPRPRLVPATFCGHATT